MTHINKKDPYYEYDPKYVYDNGFNRRIYLCTNCNSYYLKRIEKGGMTPPEYECQYCGKIVYAPKWEVID